jgi:hypothetical protein
VSRSHPGRRRGRPLLGRERRERYQIRLEPALADWLDRYGRGNRSAGIERAAKAAGYAPLTQRPSLPRA